MSIALILPISTMVTPSRHTTPQDIRIEQYVTGLKTLFSDTERFNNIDIYIIDNTVSQDSSIDARILGQLPHKTHIMHDAFNNYGMINKGAGLMTQWLYIKNNIKIYDWIIHFEPRLLVENFHMFDSMLANPRNVFATYRGFNMDGISSLNKSKYTAPPRDSAVNDHIHTGIFMISSEILLNFLDHVSVDALLYYNKSIEYELYDYLKNYQYDVFVDGTGLIRFDYVNGVIHGYSYN